MAVTDRTIDQDLISWGTMRYQHENSSLQLTNLGRDVYLLASLWTMPEMRKQGSAKRLLEQIVKMADERQITLMLYVAPYGPSSSRMDTGALKDLYYALGWVVDDPRDPIRMLRRPSA